MSDRLIEEYLDRYKGVKSEILVTTRFNESSDFNMTYLGKTNMIRDHKIAADKKFPMSKQVYTTGKQLDSTECHIILLYTLILKRRDSIKTKRAKAYKSRSTICR